MADEKKHEEHTIPDEGGHPLFEPHMVLSSQYFARRRGGSTVEGERRLIAAVLEDAILTYQKQFPDSAERPSNAFVEAETWIFRDFPGWFFSFPNVCHILGLDPEWIRDGLRRWAERRGELPETVLRAAVGAD